MRSTVDNEAKDVVTTGEETFRCATATAAGRMTIEDFGGAAGSAGFLVSLVTIGGLGGLFASAGILPLSDPNDVGSTTRNGALVGGTLLGRIGAAATNGTLPVGGDLDLVPEDFAGGEGGLGGTGVTLASILVPTLPIPKP